jgi:hypothetical protein
MVSARRRHPTEIGGDRPGQCHAAQLGGRYEPRADDLSVVATGRLEGADLGRRILVVGLRDAGVAELHGVSLKPVAFVGDLATGFRAAQPLGSAASAFSPHRRSFAQHAVPWPF